MKITNKLTLKITKRDLIYNAFTVISCNKNEFQEKPVESARIMFQ